MSDFQLKDLEDAKVFENVFPFFYWSSLTFKAKYNRLFDEFVVSPDLKLLQKNISIHSKSSNHVSRREGL